MAAGHRRRRRAACLTAVSTAPGSNRMGRAVMRRPAWRGGRFHRTPARPMRCGHSWRPAPAPRLDRPAGEDAALPGGGAIAARTGMAHQIAGAEGEQLAQTVVALAGDAWCCLPAVACCRGVRPHQAAKSRAELNCRPSPIAVTTACAVSPPMPGTVVSAASQHCRARPLSSASHKPPSPVRRRYDAGRWTSGHSVSLLAVPPIEPVGHTLSSCRSPGTPTSLRSSQ